MQFESTIAAGLQLLGDGARRTEVLHLLKDLLAAHDGLCTIPAAATDERSVTCVDGAVISTQTDAVSWIAVAATNSDRSVEFTHTAVTPVGSHGDAVRSAVMAAAELRVAVATATATTGSVVWMDGSLATPLISLVTSLHAVPPAAAAAFADTLEELDVVGAVSAYVNLASQGRVRALPKQDTARAYIEQWAMRLDEPSAHWLSTQRDRSLIAALTPPGMCLYPRPAPEIAAIEVGAPRADHLQPLQVALDQALKPWRATIPHVAYLLPTHLDRPIKYEFVPASADQAGEEGQRLAGLIDPLCRGPRMLEPLPQFIVDRHAKDSVRYVNQLLMTAVQRDLGGQYPELVRSYRS